MSLPMRGVIISILILCIFIAHIFLWRSDMPAGAKLTFTIINIAGWTIVLAPILLIDRWLEAIQARNEDAAKDVTQR